MNIDDLNDQEKSVMLARCMGWKKLKPGKALVDWYATGGLDISALAEQAFNPGTKYWYDETGAIRRDGVPNYYETDNMPLAWRVLNWASIEFSDNTDIETYIWREWEGWWDNADLKDESPAYAQRAWLDKILSLAIEAGLVDVEHERAG